MIPICAPHGMKIARSVIMMNRCFFVSRIRVAVTPGTLHPSERIVGTIAYPCRPILCSIVSIRTASLGMYPISSRSASVR